MAPAINPRYPKAKNIIHLIMSANTRVSLTSLSSRNLPPSAVAYVERPIKGKDTVQLLRAPSIESDVVWKARSFRFAYKTLRSKLDLYSADLLISVIREHFPLGTTQSEQEAESMVSKFQRSFGNISYLTPRGYYNSSGDDTTAKMHQVPRPPNVCFLEVNFDFPLSTLGEPFTVYQRCDLTYFLHLPQSLPGVDPTSSGTIGSNKTENSKDSGRASLFSAVTNLNSKFSSTPGIVAAAAGDEPPNIVVLKESDNALGKDGTPGEEKSDEHDKDSSECITPFHHIPFDSDANDKDSNEGFNKVHSALGPKTAAIFATRRSSGGRSLRTFNGALDFLEDQNIFDALNIRWNEMFELGINNAGQMNIVEYDGLQSKVKAMQQEIYFDSFCDRYQLAYVGAVVDVNELENITMEQVQKSFSFIKMRYMDTRSNEMVTTTPETVYKKFHEYIPLLPNDTNKWSFCISTMYYHALTTDIKMEMKLQGYVLPQPSLLSTKELQLQSMTQ